MMTGITGYDYEDLWALYLKCKGYGVKVTRKSGDDGADVIAIKDYKRIAYQCKLYTKPVGKKAIQEVYAGKEFYKCSKAIVVTNNIFTKQAIETAKTLSVGLLPNKTPESLIEVCVQGYKEGKINREDELLIQLPAAIQKAIISGSKKESENTNRNAVRVKSDEAYDKNEIPIMENVYPKQQIYELSKKNSYNSDEGYSDLAFEIENGGKTKKVCPLCGREFLEHSVKCPICKCGLVGLGKNDIEEPTVNVVSSVKSEKKKNRKLFYCCISVAVLIYVSIFFMAIYPRFVASLHTEKIQVTVSSKDLKGCYYADAVEALLEAGFEDIELFEDDDLIFGLLKQEGEVGKVSINGKTSFEKYEYFPKDAKIEITYHTFKPEFKSSDTNNYQEEEIPEFVEYNILQTLFLVLSSDTTMESIDSFISENNLEFTKNKYNGTPKTITYKIAFEPRVALQRYGNTGEHVTIHFNQQDCSFLKAEYFNDSTFMIALFYNSGTPLEYGESESNSSYSGYYYSKPGKLDGIVIEHANGLSTQTSYHACANAEEALLNVILSQSK